MELFSAQNGHHGNRSPNHLYGDPVLATVTVRGLVGLLGWIRRKGKSHVTDVSQRHWLGLWPRFFPGFCLQEAADRTV